MHTEHTINQIHNHIPPGEIPVLPGVFDFKQGADMAQTTDVKSLSFRIPANLPAPEGYFSCSCCGSILGFRAHVGKAIFLFTYSYPPQGVTPKLSDRRVNARMLSGDVLCPHCGTWVEFALPKPWER